MRCQTYPLRNAAFLGAKIPSAAHARQSLGRGRTDVAVLYVLANGADVHVALGVRSNVTFTPHAVIVFPFSSLAKFSRGIPGGHPLRKRQIPPDPALAGRLLLVVIEHCGAGLQPERLRAIDPECVVQGASIDALAVALDLHGVFDLWHLRRHPRLLNLANDLPALRLALAIYCADRGLHVITCSNVFDTIAPNVWAQFGERESGVEGDDALAQFRARLTLATGTVIEVVDMHPKVGSKLFALCSLGGEEVSSEVHAATNQWDRVGIIEQKGLSSKPFWMFINLFRVGMFLL
jgi:hypothetical protein